ncbi:MAG: SAM-dependent methyltransferase [Paracoccaceae bacterium]
MDHAARHPARHPARIVAKGAFAGHPVESFQPVWNSAALRIARAAWLDSGLEVFLRLDVPYGATSSGRLSGDAVQLLLKSAARRGERPCRFLELGAGSGLFAKLFLDALKELAPDIYATCTYVLTDGNQTMLDSQAEHGVLAAHAAHVETMVFDAAGDWPDSFASGFDGVFASYILDSLPAEILMLGPNGTRQMRMRCMLDDAATAAALRADLATPGINHLARHIPLRKRLNIQTRHVDINLATLPMAHAIGPVPEDDDTPMMHCHGALTCLENIIAHLRPAGLALVADYGTTEPRDPSDTIEFQSFGASAAHAVNFHQLDSYFASHPKAAYLKPAAEEGYLYSRVLYNGAADDLLDEVDLLFGEVRQRALRLPIEAARDMLRANAFQAARRLYTKAMQLQPRNWALAEEIATHLLIPAENHDDALALADFALTLNPLAPGLHRIRAEALMQLGQLDAAQEALATCLTFQGDTVETRLLQASLAEKSGDHTAALLAIAHGLAADKEGERREALIARQDQILLAISRAARADLLAEVNQLRALDQLPE